MSFLPEDDVEFLAKKGWEYALEVEEVPGGQPRQTIRFPRFAFDGALYTNRPTGRVAANECELLIIIPTGYATTQLDSWYTRPTLVRADGSLSINTHVMQVLRGKEWQFWSRHLQPGEWRPGIDGLETYIQIVRAGLRQP